MWREGRERDLRFVDGDEDEGCVWKENAACLLYRRLLVIENRLGDEWRVNSLE